MAILDTSREDFATFLDLLYGRDLNMEVLSMTRLLALSGLEDRFLTHQRRAHKAVAVRRVTAEDVREVMDLDASDAFAEVVGAAMRKELKKAKMNRIELWKKRKSLVKLIKMFRGMDHEGHEAGRDRVLKIYNDPKLELELKMLQSHQIMQVGEPTTLSFLKLSKMLI